MRARGEGLIINISSWAGARVSFLTGPAYTAAKHAVNGMTKSLAQEVGNLGVTANAICPGLVITDMVHERAGGALGVDGVEGLIEHYCGDTAIKRLVTVEEIAAFAIHLASDAGAGFSGGTISLDGGAAFY